MDNDNKTMTIKMAQFRKNFSGNIRIIWSYRESNNQLDLFGKKILWKIVNVLLKSPMDSKTIVMKETKVIFPL